MATISTKSSITRTSGAVVRPRLISRSAVKVQAKYGEQSKFFDLQDMENTAGSWDMYGVDDTKRYPALQETFFTQATDILSRREAMRGFIALFGIGSLVAWGKVGSSSLELPITKAPTKTENGKGGTLRSRA